ncbi:MAG: alpha/beta fold hydrolase, partial [bacterium]|nr:alpha/beta fold hydrolase [bacterium]
MASGSSRLVLILLLLLAPRAAGAGQGEFRQAEAVSFRVPVILIPGLEGRADSWGRSPEPGRRGAGLLGFLAREGYQEGRDLFTFDYSRVHEPDLVRLAARELAWRVAQVREKTGARQVDLVGYGYGGLIGRYYLRLPGRADEVRTLVMIATPNQGAYSAHLLRVSTEQARREPWPCPPAAGGVNPELPPFTGAAAYVDQRAVVYGVLYRHYLVESELLRGPGGAGPVADFPGWLASSRPELYRAWFLESQVPPMEANGSPDTPPAEGEALTRAYYEWLALETGRHHYLKAASRRTVTLTPPPASILRSPDLGGSIVEYLKTAVLDYLYQKGKAYLQENQLGLALQVLAWVSPAPTGGVVLERLVPERFRYPAGPDPVGRPTYQALAANRFLLDWNGEESGASRSTRYVVIAGRTLNLAGRLWRGVGDNDLVVELESTLVPMGEDDRLIVLAGVWQGTHLALLQDTRVHRAVADALAIARPVSQWLALSDGTGLPARRGRATADAWGPTYLGLDGPGQGDGLVRVTVTAEQERAAAAAGLAYHVWAHILTPDGTVTATHQGQLNRQGPVPQAVLELPAPGPHALLVGVRLVPLARPGRVYLAGAEEGLPGPCRDPWASSLVGAGGRPLAFSYEIAWKPGFAAAGPEAGPPPGAVASPAAPLTTPSSPPADGGSPPAAGAAPSPPIAGASPTPAPAASPAAPVAA